MQIPESLGKVKVTEKEADKLNPCFSNWNALNDFFKTEECTISNLSKMIVLELNGRRRIQILEKLRAKVSRLRSDLLETEILQICAKAR